MRTALALICLALLAAFPAADARAQTAPPNQAGGEAPKSEATPELKEAARLNGEVVKLYAAGKYEDALPLAERCLELYEKELGRSHTLVAGALLNLAATERSLNRLEDAKGHYRRAASILEKAGDEGVRPLINAVEGQARLESDIYNAAELHKRALDLGEKAYGPDAPELAQMLFPLGHVNELLGRRADAERYFKRFLDVAAKAKGAREDDLAVAYLRLGCIAGKDGKEGEAAAYKARAEGMLKLGPIEGGVINGKAISKPQPSYPAEAKQARAEGTVPVDMLVGENGVVLYACARGDTHPSLKAASEFAAYNARFTPTRLNGKPVKVRGVITYRFVLR
ncbi:MAG TPA: tetratricopeptide repeat protein [Pyrinomonadaceae bacterium]|jgi:TonB family protein|nr:tetratricopeptide repeat protein [Pyrinomonadaceae bacterium]